MPFYHVWFATKRRKWLLQGELVAAVKDLLINIATTHDIELLEHEAVVDHVHLLLLVHDQSELPKALNLLKGASARRIFQRFPELKLDAQTSSFWQAGYGSKEVPPAAVGAVRSYIRTQWDRLEDYER